MSENADTVSIKLLGKNYQVKCPLEKLSELQEAASYLTQKMHEASENNRLIIYEKIFMIAALNITDELIALKKQLNSYIDTTNQGIQYLQNKIDRALSEQTEFC